MREHARVAAEAVEGGAGRDGARAGVPRRSAAAAGRPRHDDRRTVSGHAVTAHHDNVVRIARGDIERRLVSVKIKLRRRTHVADVDDEGGRLAERPGCRVEVEPAANRGIGAVPFAAHATSEPRNAMMTAPSDAWGGAPRADADAQWAHSANKVIKMTGRTRGIGHSCARVDAPTRAIGNTTAVYSGCKVESSVWLLLLRGVSEDVSQPGSACGVLCGPCFVRREAGDN